MKKIVFILFLTLNFVSSQEKSKVISGIVSDGRTPLENVQIVVDGADVTLFTDAQGRYTLNTVPGSTIRYSYTGMKTIEIVVEDVTRILNVEMFPDIEELEEVVVTKSRRKSKEDLEIEYSTNPNLIRSAYGILDPSTSAYQIRMLAEDQFSEVGLCILGVLRGQFPGVGVNGDCINGGYVSIRGSSSLYNDPGAIFDVDGQIFKDAPLWLPVANMKRIAVMTGLAARNLYGGIASGGVVVINTHTGHAFSNSKLIKDKARLRNNKYKGDALTAKSLSSSEPTYLQELHEAKSLEETKKIHEFYAPRYGASYSYYVDVLTYFTEYWKDDAFTNKIVQDGLLYFNENPVALKALAYAFQSNGDFKKANELYKELFILRPNYGQSYMDLASSYRELGDGKKAASLYMRYDYLVNEGFLENDSTAFAKIMDREFNNLMTLKGKQLFSKKGKDPVLEEDFNGIRIVFEWNDSEAEFELQFVNPEGRYFTTVHSLAVDAERIHKEKLLGYSCEEFLIDESLPGRWQVNVNYLGNKSLTPSYVKATIYYDYGSAAQRKEIKVFKLGLKNVNQELFKVNNTARIVSN